MSIEIKKEADKSHLFLLFLPALQRISGTRCWSEM